MLSEFRDALRGMGEKILARKSYKVLVCCFCFLAGIIAHGLLDFKINFFWIYNAGLVLAVCLIYFACPAKPWRSGGVIKECA